MAGEYFQPKGSRVKCQRVPPTLIAKILRHRLGSLLLQYALMRSNLHIYDPPGFSHGKTGENGREGGEPHPGGRGHEATETGLAYAPVSQAHGHNHIVQCFACCTAA